MYGIGIVAVVIVVGEPDFESVCLAHLAIGTSVNVVFVQVVCSACDIADSFTL